MAEKTLQPTKKEQIFIWTAENKSKQTSKGEMSAPTEAVVRVRLRRQGLSNIKVKKKPKPLFGSGGGGKAISTADIAVFARQLAVMMSSGVPLVQSFDIVGKGHENKKMQALIMDVKNNIEGGSTLAESLRRHPLHFDELFCNLVEAGEQAGILESLLDKIATYKEKSESMRKKVKKALSYPIAVIIVAFIITAILMIFVVPVFADMFKEMGNAELPAITQGVVVLSNAFVNYWHLIFGSMGAFIYAFKETKRRSIKFQHALQRLSLKLPIVGEILNKSAIARFARTLATMFAAGTPLVEAMDSVAGATGNIVYSSAVLKMKEDIATGTQLAVSMCDTDVFPNMVVQMVSIGEESGSIDTMLGKVADFYEEEVDNLVDSLSSLMEPMIMAFLGVVIGGLVVAMYMPIFKLGSVI